MKKKANRTKRIKVIKDKKTNHAVENKFCGVFCNPVVKV